MTSDLVQRLKTRAEIRRKIPRPEPDRISEICEEAATHIEALQRALARAKTVPVKYRRMEFNAQLQNQINKAEAELTGVRAGTHAIVPREPTMKMRESGNLAIDECRNGETPSLSDWAFYCYKAMLAASEKEIEQERKD